MGTQLPSSKGAQLPILAHICCGQMAGWIKMPLGTEAGVSLGDIVRRRHSSPPLKGQPPNCRPMSVVAKRLDGRRFHMYGGRPRPRRLCVRWGPSPPSEKQHSPAQLLGHVYCGQTAGWMKTPLSTKVDLGPRHIVLDGDPTPTKGAQQPPSFRPMSIMVTVAHLSYC